MDAPKFELHQIAYDGPSLEKVRASGFKMLDNLANERPDWYEYWPIRRYLQATVLQEGTWYGFFSPRFGEKTGLDRPGVEKLISDFCQPTAPDVVLLSPQPDMGAFFLNVFEQGETFHPGFMETGRRVVQALGMDVPLETMVMDSRHIVYSNYFVARKAFWHAWFQWTEAVFAMAESSSHALAPALCEETTYPGSTQQKVFIIERVTSLMLATQPQWRVAAANTFNFAWSAFPAFNSKPELAHMSDALKIAFRECGHPQYMEAYEKIRKGLG